jgi:hypothetical protein
MKGKAPLVFVAVAVGRTEDGVTVLREIARGPLSLNVPPSPDRVVICEAHLFDLVVDQLAKDATR